MWFSCWFVHLWNEKIVFAASTFSVVYVFSFGLCLNTVDSLGMVSQCFSIVIGTLSLVKP